MNSVAARWGKWAGLAVALLVVAGFLVGSLDRTASNDSAGAARGTGGISSGPGGLPGVESRDEAAPNFGGGGTSSTLPGLGDRIVRTADLSVEVDDGAFDAAFRRAHAIATRFGGQVMAATRGTGGKDRDALSGDVVIRVPSDRFEEATNALREIGDVQTDSSSSEDVTQEYVDLNSRMRALRAEETVLVRLMGQAKSISDTLQIQQRLSTIQSEIEQITGRIRYLDARTEFSTISIHIAEPGAATGPDPRPTFASAWETAVDGLVRMATAAMIGVMWLLPFAVLALIALGVRRARKPGEAPPVSL